MIKAVALITVGLVMIAFAISRFLDYASQPHSWLDNLEYAVGAAIGAVGMHLLCKWWRTRP